MHSMSSGGRTITNPRFAEDIDGSNGINARIAIRVKEGEVVASFKYIDATLYGEGSKPEVLLRVAQT